MKKLRMLRNIWCLCLYTEAFSPGNPQRFNARQAAGSPAQLTVYSLWRSEATMSARRRHSWCCPVLCSTVCSKKHIMGRHSFRSRIIWWLRSGSSSASLPEQKNTFVLWKPTFNRQLSITTQLVLSEAENWPKQPGVDCQIGSVW